MLCSINFFPSETLYGCFSKGHLDPSAELTFDQWKHFVSVYQNAFINATYGCAVEMMSDYRQSLVLDTID